jgi:hypothetical protein
MIIQEYYDKGLNRVNLAPFSSHVLGDILAPVTYAYFELL